MKIGKVFAKLEGNPKCSGITFEERAGEDGSMSTFAVVTLSEGYTNEGETTKACVSAHEARLFIEGSVDADGNRRVKRAKAPAATSEEPANETPASDASEFTLSPGFLTSAGELGEVTKRTSKKVTVRLTAEQRETYINFAKSTIDNPEANIGAKGSAKAALAALAA